MLAARINFGLIEVSAFTTGWTIFFGTYLVMISAESVLPSASLKVKRLGDSTVCPCATLALNKPQAQIRGRYEERGVFFGIKSAVYRAESLPTQPVFAENSTFFASPNRSQIERRNAAIW